MNSYYLSEKFHTKVGNFLSPIPLLRDSDLLLTCPQSLAQFYSQLGAFEIQELPLKIAPIEIKMIWHERMHADPLHQWLRKQIYESVI